MEIRIAQSMNTLVKHAVESFTSEPGFMPAKGGNTRLSNEEVAAAVVYMVTQSRQDKKD